MHSMVWLSAVWRRADLNRRSRQSRYRLVLFLIALTILIFPIVSATFTAPPGGLIWYTFTDANTTLVNNTWPIFPNATASANLNSSAAWIPTYNLSGNGAPYSRFFANTTNLTIDYPSGNGWNPFNRFNWSISVWFNLTNLDPLITNEYIFATGFNSTNNIMNGTDILIQGGNKIEVDQFENGTSTLVSLSNITIAQNRTYHLVITFNTSDNAIKTYLNGTLNAVNKTKFTTRGPTNGNSVIGQSSPSDIISSHFRGFMDDFQIYNTTLSDSQVASIFNTGSIPLSSIVFLNTTPDDNTQGNTQLVAINATLNSTYNFNATLFLNGTSNATITNITNGTSVFIQFNVTFNPNTQNNYTYIIQAFNNDTFVNSTPKTFYIDNIPPTITWNTPSDNNQSVSYLALNTSIFLNDANLFSFELNITNLANGSQVLRLNNTGGLVGITQFNVTPVINLSFGGAFNASMLVCDGHTAEVATFNDIAINAKTLDVDGISIVDKSSPDVASVSYDQKVDRVKFNFDTTSKYTSRTYVVSSPDYINILDGKTQYEGHLVTGQHWIDFVMPGTTSTVKRIADNQVEVTVTSSVSTSNWDFSSIGTLNCVLQTRNFMITNTSSTFTPIVVPSTTQTFSLNVTYNTSFITNITAIFFYNGTVFNAPVGTNNTDSFFFTQNVNLPTVSKDVNMSLYWNFSVTLLNGMVESNQTGPANQTIIVPQIDDCSALTTKFLNVWVFDENNISQLIPNTTAQYAFNISAQGSFSQYFNGSKTSSNSTFTFCMYPASINFTTDILFQFNATAFTTRRWNALSFGVFNYTQNQSLYLLNGTANTFAVTVHTSDAVDTNLPGVLVQLLRYDIPTNQLILADTGITDSNGDVLFNTVQSSAQYAFRFLQNNVVVLSTSKMPLISSTYNFRIGSQAISYLSQSLTLKNSINSSLTYNNNTKVVTFSFATNNNSIIDNICLSVSTLNQTFFLNCTKNTIGMWTYNITTLNVTYQALAYANSTSNVVLDLRDLSIDTRTTFLGTLGTLNSLVLVLLTIMFFILLFAFEKNTAVIGTLLGFLLTYLLGLLSIGFGTFMLFTTMGVVSVLLMNKR